MAASEGDVGSPRVRLLASSIAARSICIHISVYVTGGVHAIVLTESVYTSPHCPVNFTQILAREGRRAP